MSKTRQHTPQNSSTTSDPPRDMLFALLMRHPIPTWIADLRTGAVLEANAAAVAFYGFTRDELLAMRLEDIVPAEALSRLNGDGEERYSGEWSRPLKDGRVAKVAIETYAVALDKRKVAVVLAHEPGGHRGAEEMLHGRDDLYRTIYEFSPVGILSVDGIGRVIRANPAFQAIIGYSQAELSQMSFNDYTHPEDREVGSEALARMVSGASRTVRMEKRYIRKDGVVLWASVTAAAIRDPQGKLLYTVSIVEDITRRRQIEEALQEREEQLRLFADHNPAAIAMLDRDMRYLVVSRRWIEDYRLGDTPVIGRSHYEVFPEITERWKEINRRCLAGAVEKCEEDPFHRADGLIDWIRWEVRPWHRADGSIGGIVIFSEDISSRKHAEAALRESEERFRKAFETSPDSINLNLLSDGTYVAINQGFTDIMGYTKADVLGKTSLELQIWENPDDRKRLVEGLTAKGTVTNLEARFRTKDGTIRYGLMAASVIELGGRAHIISSTHDITERKRADEALAFHRTILEEMGRIAKVGGWTIDAKTGAGAWTDEVARIHDMDPALPISRDLGFQFYTEESRPKIEAAVKDAVEKGISYDLELEIISAKGIRKRIRTIGHPVIQNGEVVRVHGSFQDITELHRIESQLRQAQKMETVGRLAGGVAHDFNNMLHVIISYVEMSLKKVEPGLAVHTYLQEILRAARRSAEITGQLLAFARKQTVSPKVVDLNDAVVRSQKMIHGLVGEDIRFLWLPGTDLWEVKIDPMQLDQILANLAANARDAIGNVGRLTIHTANVSLDEEHCSAHPGSSPGDYVVLEVSDDGRGMDRETLVHVFEPFFTTKEVGKGTGLGLATIYGIVNQNHGFIDVQSDPGAGTTFRIYLPRVEGKPVVSSPELVPAPPRGGGETVLVVEDEQGILDLARQQLQEMGYVVLAARSPEQALRMSETHEGPIHLLLTDVVMPQMYGRQLAQRLVSRRPDLKCLYMSGYTADAIAHRGMLDEGVSFIAKPFSMAALAEKVKATLAK